MTLLNNNKQLGAEVHSLCVFLCTQVEEVVFSAHLLNQVSDPSDFKRAGRLTAFHFHINRGAEQLGHANALNERRDDVKSLHVQHDDGDDDYRQIDLQCLQCTLQK